MRKGKAGPGELGRSQDKREGRTALGQLEPELSSPGPALGDCLPLLPLWPVGAIHEAGVNLSTLNTG